MQNEKRQNKEQKYPLPLLVSNVYNFISNYD